MITQNKIKEVKSLGLNKFRQKYNKFIAEGSKIAHQFLTQPSFTILELYYTQDWDSSPYTDTLSTILTIEKVDNKTMSRLSQLRNHTEILLVCAKPEISLDTKKLENNYSIYLDDVQNPGNVGTIIRIADWFGVKNVIRSLSSADFFNSKVVQSTMGSLGNVHLHSAEAREIIGANLPLYGAAMKGTDISDIKWAENGIIIMGNEGQGIKDDLRRMLTHEISIPGAKDRYAESLNVGIATGIICHKLYENGITR